MGRIHVCFAVLLPSDDPTTSWSFHTATVIIGSKGRGSCKIEGIHISTAISTYETQTLKEASGSQRELHAGEALAHHVVPIQGVLVCSRRNSIRMKRTHVVS